MIVQQFKLNIVTDKNHLDFKICELVFGAFWNYE